MKQNINTLKILIIGLFILFCSCTENKKDEKINKDVPVVSKLDFTISKTDSLTFLQFPKNTGLKDLNVSEIRINGIKSDYKITSDEIISINSELIPLGKSNIDLIYIKGNKTDTIHKPYYDIQNIDYKVVKTYPHNNYYFTEGLFFDSANNLIESTGLETESKIIFYKFINDRYAEKDSITDEPNEFGEGVSIVNNMLVHLLWKNNYLKLYNKEGHKYIKNLKYLDEGWGLCTDGNILYASDGSGIIKIIDVSGDITQTVKSIYVQNGYGIIANINELEFINGLIFANIWKTNFIYVIDPSTGYVIGKLDLSSIAEKEMLNKNKDVMNGIAYNKQNNTILITGKLWSNFYELKLDPKFENKIKSIASN